MVLRTDNGYIKLSSSAQLQAQPITVQYTSINTFISSTVVHCQVKSDMQAVAGWAGLCQLCVAGG